jgi:two-component system chemotaxis response regulator CheB
MGRPAYVVGIAASAGGLTALTRVLSCLPADFAAPVLVVQHLDPHHRSLLAEILDRRIPLAVTEAREGDRLSAGRVYIAPPNRHLLVRASGVLALSDSGRIQYVRPAADLLFQSLAESWGTGAVAVVLTGKGQDGADGVREIHRQGGLVIVQDEATADFFGMPGASIRTGDVDRVLALEAIAPALIELIQGDIQ